MTDKITKKLDEMEEHCKIWEPHFKSTHVDITYTKALIKIARAAEEWSKTENPTQVWGALFRLKQALKELGEI